MQKENELIKIREKNFELEEEKIILKENNKKLKYNFEIFKKKLFQRDDDEKDLMKKLKGIKKNFLKKDILNVETLEKKKTLEEIKINEKKIGNSNLKFNNEESIYKKIFLQASEKIKNKRNEDINNFLKKIKITNLEIINTYI